MTPKPNNIKRALRALLILFYAVAGLNHFIDPEFYYPLIPSYLPYPEFINTLSGVLEIGLAVGVAIPKFRKLAILLIIAMLITFIPSHVYFIQQGACMGEQSLCVPIWVAWVRLFPIHPLLMFWAWYCR